MRKFLIVSVAFLGISVLTGCTTGGVDESPSEVSGLASPLGDSGAEKAQDGSAEMEVAQNTDAKGSIFLDINVTNTGSVAETYKIVLMLPDGEVCGEATMESVAAGETKNLSVAGNQAANNAQLNGSLLGEGIAQAEW